MPEPIMDNVRPIATIAVFLIGLGVGWSEWTTRLNQKADLIEVQALERDLEAHKALSLNEWRVNRVLLCRLPDIRPDSYCEGFR